MRPLLAITFALAISQSVMQDWLETAFYPALLLVAQRFVYRQLMYSVVLRAVSAALSGPWVGWGKQQRTGRVDVA